MRKKASNIFEIKIGRTNEDISKMIDDFAYSLNQTIKLNNKNKKK